METENLVIGPTDEEKEQARRNGERLRLLASRLGVPPLTPPRTAQVALLDDKDNAYSWVELMHAQLDRLETGAT